MFSLFPNSQMLILWYHKSMLADKLYNSVTICFCALQKYVCLSQRSQAEAQRGLDALQHSLWPNLQSNRMAIWTKALRVLCESMNFYPVFQIGGARDRTTDSWITRSALSPYTTGDSLVKVLNSVGLAIREKMLWAAQKN